MSQWRSIAKKATTKVAKLTESVDRTIDSGQSIGDIAKYGSRKLVDSGKDVFSYLSDSNVLDSSNYLDEQQSLASLSVEDKHLYLQSILSVLAPLESPDVDQLRRVYHILTIMEPDTNSHRSFVEDLFSGNATIPQGEIEEMDDLVRISLGKDLIGFSTNSNSDGIATRASVLITRLGLSTEQLDVLTSWTEWENSILGKLGCNDMVVGEKDLPVEAIKKAAAIGMPLTALYLSGSVVGFGAAGITSGLAAIGSAAGLTILGLNPMTAGIAALILGGVAVKKVMDAKLPTSKLDRMKKMYAEKRIMEVRRNRYIALLATDVEFYYQQSRESDCDELNTVHKKVFQHLMGLLKIESNTTLQGETHVSYNSVHVPCGGK